MNDLHTLIDDILKTCDINGSVNCKKEVDKYTDRYAKVEALIKKYIEGVNESTLQT